MAFVHALNALLLSLLLCTSITVLYAHEAHAPAQAPHAPPPHPHHHHHHHPPTPPPSHPTPAPPPSHTPPPPSPPSHTPPPPPNHPPPAPPTQPPVKPPTQPPVKPPTQPPAKPPTQPPVKPPSYPPLERKKVAVQGVVYCKSCKYRGVDTLLKASPLPGAVVKLICKNTKYSLVEQTKTDKNGYFFFMPQKLTTSGSHKCKVFIISSPVATCSVPTNLHGGANGALLIRSPKPPVDAPVKPVPFELFTVGPFAFEAPKKSPCHY